MSGMLELDVRPDTQNGECDVCKAPVYLSVQLGKVHDRMMEIKVIKLCGGCAHHLRQKLLSL